MLGHAFADELAKQGVSLSWIAERLVPGLKGEARAASGKAWSLMAGQAQNRGELRDLVKERLRLRGRSAADTHAIDATLYKRLRKNPELNAQYHAAVAEKNRLTIPKQLPAVEPLPPEKSKLPKHLKTMAWLGLAGAAVGYAAGREKEAMAAGFFDELQKLSMDKSFQKIAEMIKEAPFKSMAQRRKFYALKEKGEMSQKTIDEWERETPSKLPERVKKTAAFGPGHIAAFGVGNLVGGILGSQHRKTVDKSAVTKAIAEYKAKGGTVDAAAIKAIHAKLQDPYGKTADDKTALEKATILQAIFNRAFKGKIMQKNTGRMASRFLQTSKAMGAEPTREGLRGMIQKVKTTGTI